MNRTYKKGPVISEWHWLADSSGVAFLEPAADGNYHLVLADFRRRTLEPLTSTTEKLGEYALFDVRDRDHYVYTAVSPLESKKLQKERQAELYGPATVGTGRHLDELLNHANVGDYPGAHNGLQIENSGRVARVCAAVDACEAVLAQAGYIVFSATTPSEAMGILGKTPIS